MMRDTTNLDMVKTVKRVNLLSLFTSGSTLICCALPAALVAVGSVATLTSLISSFPQLIWLSENKAWVFGTAGIMLILAGYLQWQARHAPCPADILLAKECRRARQHAFVIYWISVSVYMVGAFFAFVAPLLI